MLAKFKAGFGGESSQHDRRIMTPYETFVRLYPQSVNQEVFMPIQAKAGLLPLALDQVRDALRRSRKVRFNEPDNFGMATLDFDDRAVSPDHRRGGAGDGGHQLHRPAGGRRPRDEHHAGVGDGAHARNRRAQGHRRRRTDIVQQFLLEACALTGAGGLLGILGGVGISVAIQVLTPAIPSVCRCGPS